VICNFEQFCSLFSALKRKPPAPGSGTKTQLVGGASNRRTGEKIRCACPLTLTVIFSLSRKFNSYCWQYRESPLDNSNGLALSTIDIVMA
jgi:hypothetical protein